MKNTLKLTLILVGVLVITSCEENPIPENVEPSVLDRSSFLTTDYYVVNNPSSLGAIYLSNTQSWKVGDKIRVTGSIKFKRPDDSSYVINAYVSRCEIENITDIAIYVGYDYSGINLSEYNTAPAHIELNHGVVELLNPLSANGD